MSWRPAKCVTVFLAEVNNAWPNRDKASDGIKGDAAHAARVSDHNPDANGVVHAIDIDKDGIPADRVVEHLRRMGEYGDPRLKYLIWQRRIYSAKTGWKGEAYTGSNAHDHHFHMSVTDAHGDDTGPWHIADLDHHDPAPPPPPPLEDDMKLLRVVDGPDKNSIWLQRGKQLLLCRAANAPAGSDDAQQYRNAGAPQGDMQEPAWSALKAASDVVVPA